MVVTRGFPHLFMPASIARQSEWVPRIACRMCGNGGCWRLSWRCDPACRRL